MTWARIEDNMPDHPKIVSVGADAELVAYRAILYANRLLTDGFIPRAALPGLLLRLDVLLGVKPDGDEIAARLVAAKLWHKKRGGFLIHDFLDFNSARETVEHKRELGRERGRAFRARRRGVTGANAERNALRSALRSKRVTNANVTLHTDTDTEKKLPARARARAHDGGVAPVLPVDRSRRSVISGFSNGGDSDARGESPELPAVAKLGAGPLAGTVAHVLAGMKPVGFVPRDRAQESPR